MPPSKKPMMILLKQARAFGLGMLLATQNPVDLDYKALANIGTWWIGRLQTELLRQSGRQGGDHRAQHRRGKVAQGKGQEHQHGGAADQPVSGGLGRR
jgi:hypothetical protein